MKTVLYILKFQKSNLIKIGYTKNISNRISSIEKGSSLLVNHHQSIIICNPDKSKIVLLERNLLIITSDFSTKLEVWKNFPGINEFRTNNCCNLINQFIEDQKGYGIEYKIFTGVDVCGNYDHLIPKEYYPIFYPAKDMPSLLKEDALKFCEEKNKDLSDIINYGVYVILKHYGYQRTDKVKDLYSKYFKA